MSSTFLIFFSKKYTKCKKISSHLLFVNKFKHFYAIRGCLFPFFDVFFWFFFVVEYKTQKERRLAFHPIRFLWLSYLVWRGCAGGVVSYYHMTRSNRIDSLSSFFIFGLGCFVRFDSLFACGGECAFLSSILSRGARVAFCFSSMRPANICKNRKKACLKASS